MEPVKPTAEELEMAMQDINCIRNVCILAHVDHGKSCIADTLIAVNRLLSLKVAGSLRYLDDRPDEQQRGITMKCSGIALLSIIPIEKDVRKLLINLVDTPGHIDFSAEVCAAIRVSDGALLIVDVVEGVCSQTKRCMQQAYEERTKMILVLNKFDRLFSELKFTKDQVFERILRVLEDCNAYMAELYKYDWSATSEIEDAGILFNPPEGNVIFASARDGWGFTLREIAEMFVDLVKDHTVDQLTEKLWDFDCYLHSNRKIYTGAIERGKENLFMAMALKTVSAIYEALIIRQERTKIDKFIQRLNIKRTTRQMYNPKLDVCLRHIMQAWQPIALTLMRQIYHIIPTPKKIPLNKTENLLNTIKNCEDDTTVRYFIDKNMLPAFENTTDRRRTFVYVSKMFCVNRLSLSHNKPKPFELRDKNEPSVSDLCAQMRARLSSHSTINDAATYVVEECPSTSQTVTICGNSDVESTGSDGISRSSSTVILEPQAGSSQTSISCGTTYTVPSQDDIEEEKVKYDSLEQDTANNDKNVESHLVSINSDVVVLAFARVYTGKLYVGQSIYVLRPEYVPRLSIEVDPETYAKNNPHIEKVVISELFMLYGRDYFKVDEVPAGNFCAIGGLRDYISRTATLSTEIDAIPFVTKVTMAPVIRNVIEPVNIKDMPILKNALKLLTFSDPSVEVMWLETGDLVLITAGDVHLAKCIADLSNVFAKIDFTVSIPQISLQETVAVSNNQLQRGCDLVTSYFSMTVSILSLDPRIREIIKKYHEILIITEDHQNLNFQELLGAAVEGPSTSSGADLSYGTSGPDEQGTQKTFLNPRLSKASTAALKALRNLSVKLGKETDFLANLFKRIWTIGRSKDNINLLLNHTNYKKNIFIIPPADARNLFSNSIVNAFQSFIKAGPICEEPIANCIFVVTSFELLRKVRPEDITPSVSSSLETSVKKSFQNCFEQQPQRIMEPMYYAEIECTPKILGKVYSSISKLHGQVVQSIHMNAAEKGFQVKAYIPVIHSHEFAQDILKSTSGHGLPNVFFSHYEIIDGDPFYDPAQPGRSEEKQDKIAKHNRAVQFRRQVRRRKGLPVDDQVVVHAERQRTHSRKK